MALKKLGSRISVSFLFLITCAEFASAQDLTGVASVIDGDTLEIHGQRIRLHGIDAPESRQLCSQSGTHYRCGQKSSLALSDQIGREPIFCESTDPNMDRYGRVIGRCFKGQEDLNAWMVLNGWALAYRKYSIDYVQQEETARLSGAGIWAGEFVVPEKWRRGERLETEVSEEIPDSCKIKGNISSKGARIYHVPEGRWYDRTRIDTSKGEQYFCSEEEAVAAGWRKSRQ